MVDSNFVRRHDKSLVVYLLELVIKRCLNGVLCASESSTDMEDSCPPQTFPNPES